MIPEQLKQEVAELIALGYKIELVEEGSRVYIIFRDYKLKDGLYNMSTTDLLVFNTTSYPSSHFDMFWVDQSLTLKNGGIPQSAGHIEGYLNRNWRRFSIHPYNAKPWNPNEDSLTGYLSYVHQRLINGN